VRQTIIELVAAPLLVGASGLASRRWGPHTGGLVSAFPAIVGPVLLIAALDHGARFAARAAEGTLLGLVALSAFALTYGRLAARAGWQLTLLSAWSAAAVATVAVGLLAGRTRAPAGLAIAALSLFAAHRLLGGAAPAVAARASVTDPGSLPARMLSTALLVTALAACSGAFGAVVGGILAALPVLASLLAVVTHRREGAGAVIWLLRGMLAGMIAFVAFCEVLVLLLASAGLPLAFVMAGAVALAAQGGILLAFSQCSRVRKAITSKPSTIPKPV
jgi:hypothetical protein